MVLRWCFPHLFLQNSAGRSHDRLANFQVLSRELPSFNVGASCAEGASGVPQAGGCALLGISRNFRPFFLISIYGLRWVKVSKWLRFISFISKPYWNMLSFITCPDFFWPSLLGWRPAFSPFWFLWFFQFPRLRRWLPAARMGAPSAFRAASRMPAGPSLSMTSSRAMSCAVADDGRGWVWKWVVSCCVPPQWWWITLILG